MRIGIGIRWWLGLAFAVIAAVTALAVASVFTNRSGEAFRGRAKELVAGTAFVASEDVTIAMLLREPIKPTLDRIARERQLALFLYDDKGRLISPSRSYNTSLSQVVFRRKAVLSALRGQRFVTTSADGRLIVVGVPLESGVLLAQAARPQLAAELGIVRKKIVEAAGFAIGVGVLVGLVVASLISVRLRRIASAAAEIERGNFERPLRASFDDEVGSLARTVDRMRERLRESFSRLEFERDRLRSLLERLHEGVVTVDPSLRVQFANGEACRILGVPRLEEGEPLPDPWPDLSLREFARSLFGPGAEPALVRTSPDDERLCTVTGIPGKPAGEEVIIVLADVSERERREVAEREFVSNASHELRTPLTTILGAVEALQSGAKDEPEERDRFLSLIERETRRLARLARALLVLARVQTREELPPLAPIELRPLLEEVAAELQPAPEVDVRVVCPPGLEALGDRDLAEQALRNVAENAAKNTDRGRIVLSAERRNGDVLIAVEDTGRGLDQASRERIFDRFYRGGSRDPNGFGLGLAIVREAVLALGGVVELESTAAGGTRVTISLHAPRVRR